MHEIVDRYCDIDCPYPIYRSYIASYRGLRPVVALDLMYSGYITSRLIVSEH